MHRQKISYPHCMTSAIVYRVVSFMGSCLPTPLSKSLLLSEPVNGQSDHRLTKVSRDLRKDLGVIEVGHGLWDSTVLAIRSETEGNYHIYGTNLDNCLCPL